MQVEKASAMSRFAWMVAVSLAAAVVVATHGSKSYSEPVDEVKPLAIPFTAEEAQAGQAAWARKLKTEIVEKNTIGMEFVLIPPGKFKMGYPADEKDRFSNTKQVDVTLTRPFYLGKTEVTQKQWIEVMGTRPWKDKEYVMEGDDYSATYISWKEASEFCQKLTEREREAGQLPVDEKYALPTEAQWEYACRAGTTTLFSFGNDKSQLGEYAWFHKNSTFLRLGCAREVGKKRPNAFGLYDMHGNVYEWCEDVNDYKDLPGGNDPVRLGTGERICRGGGWAGQESFCQSAAFLSDAPDASESFYGFRVVRVASNE